MRIVGGEVNGTATTDCVVIAMGASLFLPPKIDEARCDDLSPVSILGKQSYQFFFIRI
jgi:hypothetical protein